jgi:prepilin-type N-terminal cleavage/methylation domain-containing protein
MNSEKEKNRGQTGFTLIEVLTVIGIIAVLTCLAFPATRMVEKVVLEAGACKGLRVIQGAFELYHREMGMYPVNTVEPSRLFFREIDRFLPDTYYIRHAENQFVRGYRLFAYGEAPSGAGGDGGGGFGGGSQTVERWGSEDYVLMAVPIQSNLGLSTFYLDPGGVITKDDPLRPE